MFRKLAKLNFIFLSWCIALKAKAAGWGDAFGSNLTDVAGRAGLNTKTRTVEPTIQNAINVGLSFLGIIFLALALYAGYNWMTAQGDKAKVDKAQKILVTAVIGLIIIVAVYAITFFVMSRFTKELA
ncbi:MAG: hypothetical protein PHR00_00480 [Patescibacteria group bacterium]|nr:hypothetical protein [Patescibacteria group bacterium]